MHIQHNLAAVNTSRNQGIANKKLQNSLERLSSGYRIIRAGDDAAGLAISESMRSQINGLDQAMHNLDDGVGMAQTGDGALTEVHAMLGRLKTLAVQAANGTFDNNARDGIEAEKEELLQEIDRIGQSTDYDDIPLFESTPPLPPFAPPTRKDDITLQIGQSSAETLPLTRYHMGREALMLDKLDFSGVDEANASIPVIEDAIQAVTVMRSDFGAAQNHLERTHNNLSVTHENMTAAESQIRDTNMAEQITEYTRDKIILDASYSTMKYSNSLPEMVMKLLQ